MDESEQALSKIKSEAVTTKQLIYNITDDDLEEIGISPKSRTAILSLAEVIMLPFCFKPAQFTDIFLRRNETESR
jgi:hypothetical protein